MERNVVVVVVVYDVLLFIPVVFMLKGIYWCTVIS